MDRMDSGGPGSRRRMRSLLAAVMMAALMPAPSTQADTIYLPRGADGPGSRACPHLPREASAATLQADPDPFTACDDPAPPDADAGRRRV